MLLLREEYIGGSQKNQPFELINDMDNNARIRPQSKNNYFSDSTIELSELSNTYPISSEKYILEQTEFLIADSIYKNPLDESKIILNIGKHLFDTYCTYCHGNSGKADGPVITDVELSDDEEGFPTPPDLSAKRSTNLSDARIYHIISSGQNLMFSYSDRISSSKRWALVKYIRKLQEDKNAE